MIDLYSGTPGSGKSLHLASYIYWQLWRGEPVVANVEINTTRIKKSVPFTYIATFDLDPAKLISFSRDYFKGKSIKEDKILLVIDECQLIFNAREWSKAGRSEWLSFFTQHRKYGYHVILVAQFDSMIDKQIRSLIEYQYIHRKVSNFGLKGKLLSLVMGGKMHVAVKMWYPMKEKVGSEFFRARKRVFRLYDTYAVFDQEKEPAAAGAGSDMPRPAAAGSGIDKPR